jgi:heme/copper-type cytochrome/quinol oxidase subunit 2
VFTVRDPTQNSFLDWGQEEEAAVGLLLLAMMMMMVMVLSSFVALLLVASYHNNFGFLSHHYHVGYLAPIETFSSLLPFVITNTKSGTAGTSSL